MGAAAAATIGVVFSSHDTVAVQVFGQSAQVHEASVVFVAGAIAGVVFTVGLSMLLSGMTRGRHRRKDRKRTERQRLAEQKELRARNQELERSLAEQGTR
jgi:TRAP-type C4-dicarboxylate transport system permease large subunit